MNEKPWVKRENVSSKVLFDSIILVVEALLHVKFDDLLRSLTDCIFGYKSLLPINFNLCYSHSSLKFPFSPNIYAPVCVYFR